MYQAISRLKPPFMKSKGPSSCSNNCVQLYFVTTASYHPTLQAAKNNIWTITIIIYEGTLVSVWVGSKNIPIVRAD